MSNGESRFASNCGVNTKVLVVEDRMRVLEGFFGCYICDFLLDVNDGFWGLNDEWDFLLESVLFNFIDGKLFDGGYFVWHQDSSSVMLPSFDDKWLINNDSVEILVPFGHLEFVLNGEWLLFVFSYGDLFAFDVWHLLNDFVLHSLGDFERYFEFFLIWDLVDDCVWDLFGDNVWDLVGDGVRYFFAGDIRDLFLDFVWDLHFDGIRDLFGNFICLKIRHLVLFGNVVGFLDLVWIRVRLSVSVSAS